ncbi:hypothetical protein [Thalassoglobus sp.]|uniref:hypothetical protein n=1 Tax=Thalassoglobus sp. TaxID=2795869 RepID=UPI003AA90AE1
MQLIRFMGLVPLGIGLTLIFSLWTGIPPFGFAPLFFKIFGTFVAIPFVVIGMSTLSGKLSPEHRIRSMMENMHQLNPRPDDGPAAPLADVTAGYQCDGCGASLAENADVSPHGDVKCNHCGRWFNIHKT